MDVLFVTQFFYPDIQATSKIFLELCEDLAKDYRVKVICGLPLIEAEEVNRTAIRQKETHNGIGIVRLFSARKIKKSLLDRAMNHISFALSSFIHLLFDRRADVFIFTSDNPLNFLNTFLFLRKPKIYLCEDLYLEQGLTVGLFKKDFVVWLLDIYQRLSFRFADKIIVIGKKMKSYLETRGIPREKIEIIPNWVDVDKIEPCDQNNPFSQKHGLVDKFVVLHSGRIGLTQNLELLLECAEAMSGCPDIRFVIVGEGTKKEKLIELARKKNLNNTIFLPYQPEEMLRYSLASASVSVILCKGGLSSYLFPSRLYSIMASSRPVIASVDEDTEVYDIIKESGCGITIKPGDLEGLKEVAYKIYKNRDRIRISGDKGRDYVIRHFARSSMTERYKKVIERITR